MSGVARPWSGQVMLDGTDISALPRRSMARQLAVVPQETVAGLRLQRARDRPDGPLSASRHVRSRGARGSRRRDGGASRDRHRGARRSAVPHAQRRREAARRHRVGARAARHGRSAGAIRGPGAMAQGKTTTGRKAHGPAEWANRKRRAAGVGPRAAGGDEAWRLAARRADGVAGSAVPARGGGAASGSARARPDDRPLDARSPVRGGGLHAHRPALARPGPGRRRRRPRS